MGTRMGTRPKRRTGIECEARQVRGDRRGIPGGANHEALPQAERWEELLPLREIVHIRQRSAVELHTRGFPGTSTEPLLEGSYLPGERVIERERPLQDSPCGGLRPRRDTGFVLRDQQGLLMEHHGG